MTKKKTAGRIPTVFFCGAIRFGFAHIGERHKHK